MNEAPRAQLAVAAASIASVPVTLPASKPAAARVNDHAPATWIDRVAALARASRAASRSSPGCPRSSRRRPRQACGRRVSARAVMGPSLIAARSSRRCPTKPVPPRDGEDSWIGSQTGGHGRSSVDRLPRVRPRRSNRGRWITASSKRLHALARRQPETERGVNLTRRIRPARP